MPTTAHKPHIGRTRRRQTAQQKAKRHTALLPDALILEWDPTTQELPDLVPEGITALGVAGGDGTVASVAQLALARQLPLAGFPRCTLNHFAGAPGWPRDADPAKT